MRAGMRSPCWTTCCVITASVTTISIRWRISWREPDRGCSRSRWRTCWGWSTSPTSRAPSTNIRTGGAGFPCRSNISLPQSTVMRSRPRRGSGHTPGIDRGRTLPCRIEDYGLIGDCETAALVGRDGSIDWLCWPAFDCDACFASLLGAPEHGRWQIAPSGAIEKCSRRYRGDTLILETRFEAADGIVTLMDFMPPRGKASGIVRLVRGEAGRVTMRMELIIRFGFGRDIPWVRRAEQGTLLAICGPDMTVLRTPVETRGEHMTTVADFEVSAGQTVPFVLTYGPSHLPLPEPIDPAQALRDTEDFWSEWSSRCT